MDMRKVLEFLLAIPKQDRPKNLADILATLGNMPYTDGKFVAGNNRKIYATCHNRFVEVSSVADADDFFDDLDIEVMFQRYVDYLNEITPKIFEAPSFNLYCQQLLEFDAERAMPIIEKKLAELCGSDWELGYLAHQAERFTKVFQMFLSPKERITDFDPKNQVKIITPVAPAFLNGKRPIVQNVLTSFYRLDCSEFLLQQFVEN